MSHADGAVCSRMAASRRAHSDALMQDSELARTHNGPQQLRRLAGNCMTVAENLPLIVSTSAAVRSRCSRTPLLPPRYRSIGAGDETQARAGRTPGEVLRPHRPRCGALVEPAIIDVQAEDEVRPHCGSGSMTMCRRTIHASRRRRYGRGSVSPARAQQNRICCGSTVRRRLRVEDSEKQTRQRTEAFCDSETTGS